MKTQFGKLIAGDFENITLTIKISGRMIVQGGEYAIVPKNDYDILVAKSNHDPNSQPVEFSGETFFDDMKKCVE